jgi:hypothetical protein
MIVMSVQEFPSKDSESRMERAEQTTITDVRTIAGDNFGVPDEYTVYEVDLINESGETRENITIIPRILFENTKDVQHRHEHGIIGKYTLALAQESDEAKQALLTGIDEKRDSLQSEVRDLQETDSRLLHFKADLDGI